MFKSIVYLRYDKEINSHIYRLEDSDFECEIAAPCNAPVDGGWASSPMPLLVFEYKNRNLPVAKNIALLYTSYHKLGYEIFSMLERNKIYADEHYSELNYGTEIYPEVKEKLETFILLS